MKYNIGDRVKVKKEFDGRNLKGRTGTIICSAKGDFPNLDWGVEFDEPIETWGHSCNNRGKDGFCRYGKESELELINDNKIVITTNGKEVLARLYGGNKVIKTATAKCSPEDTFNFETGAKLAYDRLMTTTPSAEVETSKYKAGDKVKVIGRRSCHGMNMGEVVTLDYVRDDESYSMAWFTKEHKDRWYIRECDFEPYKESEKKPLEIEVGKKYLLKPYEEVKDHMGLSERTWGEIRKRYVVVKYAGEKSATYVCDTCYFGAWVVDAEAFEREYIDETKAETTTESELKVGDLVKVKDDGEHYPDYRQWLTRNAPQLEKYFAKDDDLKNGDWGVIRAIAPHGDRINRMLCALELPKNKVFIIGAKGLEKLSK